MNKDCPLLVSHLSGSLFASNFNVIGENSELKRSVSTGAQLTPRLPSCTLIPVVRAVDNDPQLHPSLENCPWPMGAPLPGEAWQVSSPTLKWPMTSQRSQKLGPFAPRANNSVVQFMLPSLTNEIQALGLETTSLFGALPFSSLLLVLLQVSSESTPWITYVQPGSGSASKETKRMFS